MAVLALWYWSQGSISVETVNTPKVEAFYWAAITLSQTLGTALGDWAGRYRRARLRGRRAAVRRRARRAGGRLLLDQDLAGHAVLGGLHPDAAARRHGRRLARQADPARRPRPEPPARLGGDRGLHPRLHPAAAAARRHASGARRRAQRERSLVTGTRQRRVQQWPHESPTVSFKAKRLSGKPAETANAHK